MSKLQDRFADMLWILFIIGLLLGAYYLAPKDFRDWTESKIEKVWDKIN